MARQDAWADAVEAMLVEAWICLQRLPDQERGWLASGERSWWPQIVRDRLTDYAETEAPRLPLARREMALVSRVFLADDWLFGIVPQERRALVATVIALKARPERRGFRWERVWEAMGGKASGATTDTLRSRYETQLRRMAFEQAEREAKARGVEA